MNDLIKTFFDQRAAPVLLGFFLLLYLMEGVSVLRQRKDRKIRRTFINAIVAIPGFVGLRFLLLPAMVYVAFLNQHWKVGLNYMYDLPSWLEAALAFMILDYSNYLWHVANHKLAFLWRFHVVHHTDVDLDVTTAIRFHAGELIFSVFVRGFAVFIIGATPNLVLLYELVFELATQFHHSNLRLPFRLEKVMNYLVVTPRMHGVHHSRIKGETDSNYSVIFSVWDRIHNTVNLHIKQNSLDIGVPGYDNPGELTVGHLLKLPFTNIRFSKTDEPARGGGKKNTMLE